MSHTKPKAFHTRNLQELRNHYKTAFKSLSCEDLMSLAMSIYAKKQELEENNRKLGQVDEQYMRQAEERLHEEFSIALSIPKEEVPIYIDRRMEKIAR
jgi:CarD family transcriptional regulator